MARQRKLSPERKAFINSLIEATEFTMKFYVNQKTKES